MDVQKKLIKTICPICNTEIEPSDLWLDGCVNCTDSDGERVCVICNKLLDDNDHNNICRECNQ